MANHSKFCNGIRKGMIHALKATPEALRSKKLTPVLAFALKLNLDASNISQSDIETVLEAGWSEQTIEDITGLVAIQKLYNTIATGLGFNALQEAAFTEIGQDTVQKGGYAASFRSYINQPG
ncbi:MAG: hypothetical protein QM479_00885 [Pseudomonadota bacterium]